MPFGTVLLEEVGFRGALHGLLGRATAGTATAVSSALFGLWHVLPAIDMTPRQPRALSHGRREAVSGETSRVVAGPWSSTAPPGCCSASCAGGEAGGAFALPPRDQLAGLPVRPPRPTGIRNGRR